MWQKDDFDTCQVLCYLT